MTRLAFCATAFALALAAPFSYARDLPAATDKEVVAAIDKAEPGDTILLKDGAYEGGWKLKAGKPDQPISLRAEHPGRVFVGSLDVVSGFEPAKGFLYAHATSYPKEPSKMRELDTGKQLRWMATPIDVDEVVGSYCWEAETKRLFVHPTDSAGTAHHTYAPVPSTTGITLADYTRVEGLVMTGFGNAAVSGQKVTGCVIQNCKLYRNGSGVVLSGSKQCKVRNNEVWENRPDYSQGSQISCLGPTEGMLIEGNLVRKGLGDNNGIFIYSGNHRNNVFRRNIVVGANGACSKPFGKDDLAEFNVCTDGFGLSRMRYNTYARPEWARPDTTTDLQLDQLKADPKFADPAWFDFRLQSDSPARGKGRDGTDLGAYQYKGDVFYVKPDGSDEAEGTSLASAWKTLRHAAQRLQGGQTLYVAAGRYDGPLELTAKTAPEGEKTRVRVFGRGKAFLTGGVKVRECTGLELANLCVSDAEGSAFQVTTSSDVTLLGCAAVSNRETGLHASDSQGVRVLRCALWSNGSGGVQADQTTGLEVISCILADNGVAQIRLNRVSGFYGAFNASRGKTLGIATLPAGSAAVTDLAAWRQACGSDATSRLLDEEPLDPAKCDFRIAAGTPLATAGLYSTPVGPDGVYAADRVERKPFERVQVLSTDRTTANLLWHTPGRMIGTALQWGRDKVDENLYDRAGENNGEYELIHTVSLVDLAPDTTYRFRPGFRDHSKPGNPLVWDTETYEFHTAKTDPEPRQLFVSLDGDDSHDGLTRQSAWRTLHKAAREARAGDTVTILPGRYLELLRPLQTGAGEQRRITFRGERPLSVFLDGGMIRHQRPGRPHNVQLHGKAFVTIENITGEKCSENIDYGGYRGGWGYAGIFRVSGGAMNVLRNCVADARYRWMVGFCTFGAGKMPGMPEPQYGLKITDSATLAGWRAVFGYANAPLLLDHNVYFVSMTGMYSITGGPAKWVSRNCIYQDLIYSKRTNRNAIFRAPKVLDSDYCAFAWMPESRRTVLRRDRRDAKKDIVSLEAWRKFSGRDSHSIEHTPSYPLTKIEKPNHRFDDRALKIEDFVLPKDSPLRGKGTDGSDIGVRWEDYLRSSER